MRPNPRWPRNETLVYIVDETSGTNQGERHRGLRVLN
jgi:hypothetical protein